MAVRNPMEMHPAFEKAFNSGNLQELVALYEKDAILVAEPGRTVAGPGPIGEAYKGYLAAHPTMSLKTEAAFEGDGYALLHGRWELNGTGPDGAPFQMKGRSCEVLRRQPDGTWLFVIDNPFSPAG
ncbi:MAG TPA: DUF4440 domain-containing protein [Bryobacteraceae bacterium]|jgi:ketosteroid isomerase-like protein|nr:DUF4440 domain-containing protein [Bryobacteraceae bacterium]